MQAPYSRSEFAATLSRKDSRLIFCSPPSENPVKGLAPSKKIIRKTIVKRRPFSEKELLLVFGSQELLMQKTTNAARYWIPLLCLFQISRREEGAQLAVADIQEDQGIHFIRINDDEKLGQNLKNEGSRRRVPIHPSLRELGFLDYVQTMRQAGHVRLFPELTKGNSGYADPVGKWFGRLVTKLGIVDEAVVLHSLRHGGISKLTGAGVRTMSAKCSQVMRRQGCMGRCMFTGRASR